MIFANPLFLIALVAVAIPVVVHLFSFRRYRKVYFSNVDRIVELRDETRRQSRLRQYLLLAARVLAVLFLVLAFAQPFIPVENAHLRPGGTAVSLFLDNSFSMGATDSEGTLLDKGKERVRELARAYRPDDRFQLLTCDQQGSQFRWMNRDELLLALDAVEVSPRSATLAEVTRRQHDFLLQTRAANRHAYLISDMQRSAADFADLPRDTSVFTTLVPVEAQDASNLFFDTLVFDAPAYTRGATVSLKAVLRNEGPAVEKIPVRLFINGHQRALASVDLPAGGTAEASLSFVLDEEGVADGYVETTDYPLTFDDRIYFSLNVVRQLQVRLVGTDNPSLRRLFAADTLVSFHRDNESGVDFTALAASDFVIFNELRTIPSGLAHAARQFVSDGGTLLIVPAPEADLESYNALLSSLQAPRLKEWFLGEVKASDLNLADPLFRGVFDGRSAEMELPVAKGSFRLASSVSTVFSPLLSAADGAVLLGRGSHGTGQIFLAAMPLRAEFSDFVQQALFVPTFFNMALFSRPPQPFYYSLNAADPLPLPVPVEAGQARLLQVDGDFEMVPDVRTLAGRQVLLLHAQLSQPGNYRLIPAFQTPPQSQVGYSFNFPREESLMSFLSPAELKEALERMGDDSYAIARPGGKSLETYVRRLSEGRPLWRWCLLAALLMLAAEIAILRWPQPHPKTDNNA